jgi:hypothetical protein
VLLAPNLALFQKLLYVLPSTVSFTALLYILTCTVSSTVFLYVFTMHCLHLCSIHTHAMSPVLLSVLPYTVSNTTLYITVHCPDTLLRITAHCYPILLYASPCTVSYTSLHELPCTVYYVFMHFRVHCI